MKKTASATITESPPATKPVRRTPCKPPSGSRDAHRLATAILEVLAGIRTPSDAATVLAVSLPRYYLLEQRALGGLLAACEPRPKGRTSTPQRQITALEKELTRLRQECGRQQALVRAAQRTVGLAMPAVLKPATKANGQKRRVRRPSVRALKMAAAWRADSAGSTADESLQPPTANDSESLAREPRSA